jgi:allantoinase
VLWTEARRRGFKVEDMALWLSVNPARFAGVGRTKGRLAWGADADIVLWDPDAPVFVEPGMIQHRHKLTPYAGMTLQGKVKMTFLGGKQVYHEGSFPAGPCGRILNRTGSHHELHGTH